MRTHTKPNRKSRLFKCDKCESIFKHAKSLRFHAGKHTDLERDGVDCPTCWKRFGSSAMLMEHLKIADCERRYVCSECQERFKSIKMLKLHMCSHNIGLESFVCRDCDVEFTTWDTITHHAVMTHEPWRAWYCTDCEEKFVDKYRFKKHKCKAIIESLDDRPPKKKQVKPPLRFCCEVCGRFYSSKILLTLHLESHSNQSKDYLCWKCNLGYSSQKNLWLHWKICHQNVLRYTCEICCREFHTRWDLSSHALVHSSVKPFQCSICGIRFKYKQTLHLHLKNHTGEKPEKRHSCSVCNRRFLQRSLLTRHIMFTHTGVKLFSCEFCGKGFAYKKSLDIHIMSRAHKGERPFKCEFCQKSFSREPYMKLHMQRQICILGLKPGKNWFTWNNNDGMSLVS